MRIFLDKEFVRNFWSVSWNKEVVLEHFRTQFLRNTKDAIIFTNYSSLDEISENDEDTFFLEELFEGVPKMEFNINLADKDVLAEHSNEGGFKMFFIEQDEKLNGQLEKELGYEFVSSYTINEKWERHYRNRSVIKTLSLPPDKNDPDIFNDWSDLEFVSESPNNSILLIDKYILSDKSNNRLKNNLFPLLKSILPKNAETPLYLTIIAGEVLSENSRVPVTIERAEKVYRQIHSFLAQYKYPKVFLTIINNDKMFYPGELDMHDRVIYTNSYYLKSTKGWDLFINGKRKIVNSTVEVFFNFQRFQMKELRGHFAMINEYIRKMKRMEVMGDIFKHHPETIENPLLN